MVKKGQSQICLRLPFFILLFILLTARTSFSESIHYKIDPAKSTLECSLRYTVIGRYSAQFKRYSGEIDFNPKDLASSAVNLNINTNSLQSNFPKLDRLAKSSRLLDSQKYPQMQFKSRSIFIKDGQYYVTGLFTLHGIGKEMTFPFKIQDPQLNSKSQSFIIASGIWRLNRKDFGVVWHPVLDQGGVIVGNTVTVKWAMTAVAN